jgi:hypothetical protein
MPNGKLEIVVESLDFEVWIAGLGAQLRAL